MNSLDQYKSAIDGLRWTNRITAYEAAKLKMHLVFSCTREKTMRTIEELMKHKHLMGL